MGVFTIGLGIASCGSWKQYDASDLPLNYSDHWVPGITPIKCPGGARKDWGSTGFAHLEAESHDRTTIDLPAVQHRLAAAILALKKPTVIFLLNGGSVAIEPELESHAAIIEAFYPGFEGGKAIARSLFGQTNRFGRMPYTVYKADWVNSHNNMSDMDVTHNRTYRYGADGLVSFGAGGSLTKFKLAFANHAEDHDSTEGRRSSRYDGSAVTISTTDDSSVVHRLNISVTNTGTLTGDEVLQLYLLPQTVPGLAIHPTKTLLDFVRVRDVAAGGTAAAAFVVTRDSCLLATQAGTLDSVPGEYMLSVEDGAGEVLTKALHIVGQQTAVVPFPGATADAGSVSNSNQ
jgi:beta-glucosidase